MALLHRYKTALTPVVKFYISRHNQLMFLSNFLREVRSSFCQFVKSEYLFCGFFPLTVAWTCWDILNVVMGRNVPEKRNMFTAWNKPKNQISFHDWNNNLSLKDKQLTLFCCFNGPNNEAVNRGHNVKMYFASTNTFFKPTQFLPTQHDLHVLSIRIMTEAARPLFWDVVIGPLLMSDVPASLNDEEMFNVFSVS